ncbi:MAG TPA: twin-arginine translocase subunit TatC [Candidatus Dormibacteraeota bacterium]|nr:twin-arginine translocase subunit TatC [Candidatus Dormibacteraeota bacterium]
MTIMEHLQDLRRALIISALAWVVAAAVMWFFSNDILSFMQHRAALKHLVYLTPTGGFTIRFQVALYAGTLVACPIIFWQLWWFVAPGLHVREKRVILPLVFATTFFFLVGVGFAFWAMPLFFHVLKSFSPPGFEYIANATDLLSFMLAICIAFGIVFELPVVLWTLGMLGIISSAWLWKQRLYWVIGLGVIANLMTPGFDPFTPLIVFIPLVFLFFGTLLLLKISGK